MRFTISPDFLPVLQNRFDVFSLTRQEEEAKTFIDAGADLILGSHPHVVQNFEEYKGKMIFYSLGNFTFDQYWSEDTMQGLGVEILLEKSDNKIIAEYKQHKILINNDSQPPLVE